MPFTNPTIPNQADFLVYIRDQGVSVYDLPDNSDYITWAFNHAINWALEPGGDTPSIVYVMAVYQLGFHHLLKVVPDQSAATYFADLRAKYGLLSFTSGPIIAAADESTYQNMQSADWMKTMTLSSLDLLKTPWGREYLMYAQSYGPTIVGVS